MSKDSKIIKKLSIDVRATTKTTKIKVKIKFNLINSKRNTHTQNLLLFI